MNLAQPNSKENLTRMKKLIIQIFQDNEVTMNYRVPCSKRSVEVDVFVPSHSLALEYNGEYHYQFVGMYHLEIHLFTHVSIILMVLKNVINRRLFPAWS